MDKMNFLTISISLWVNSPLFSPHTFLPLTGFEQNLGSNSQDFPSTESPVNPAQWGDENEPFSATTDLSVNLQTSWSLPGDWSRKEPKRAPDLCQYSRGTQHSPPQALCAKYQVGPKGRPGCYWRAHLWLGMLRKFWGGQRSGKVQPSPSRPKSRNPSLLMPGFVLAVC